MKLIQKYVFNSENDFLDSLRLDYRRNKYYEDYALGLITDKEVEKYSSEAANFILNAIQLPGYFEALWYLGAYFPLLICQLRV